MKKIFIIFLSLCCYFSFAQEDNKQKYTDAVDYVICVCINDTGEKQKDCDNGDYYQESDFQDKSNSNSNYLLFEEFQKLKEETKADDKVVNFLSNDIFSNEKKYAKIYAFSQKRKGEKIDSIKVEIREHLNSIYSDVKTEPKSEEKKGIKTPVSNAYEIQKSETQKSSFFAINFWTILSTGLLLVGVIFFFNQLKRRISKLNNRIGKIEQNLHFLESTKPDNKGNNSFIQIDKKIKEIENRVDEIVKFSNVSKKENPVSEQPKEVILQVPKKEPETTFFYMATPDRGGFFNVSSQHNSFKQGATYYKFQVEEKNKNKATFEFFSDEYGDKLSANYPQTYIEPVCEPQNAQNPNAKKITTIETGVAENQGDKWVVTKKAKIRYE